MALSAPQTVGDMLPPADIENHVLLVIPTEFHEHIPNVNTKPGEKSPAIRVNVADLSAPSGQPVVYRGALWFNALLHGGLRRQLGETILGMMTKGQANPGKNPPWQLTDMMTNADWVTFAENWLKTDVGQAFEAEAVGSVVRPTDAQATAGAQASALPAPPAPAAAPAGPPASPAPAAPPAAPAAAPAPVAAPPAGDINAALAALPPEEQARMLALLQQGQNGQAAH